MAAVGLEPTASSLKWNVVPTAFAHFFQKIAGHWEGLPALPLKLVSLTATTATQICASGTGAVPLLFSQAWPFGVAI
jgi:hypothetical protein